MSDPFWFLLLAKMATSAFVVVTASLLAERFGPFVGAMIATLPLSVGPIFVYLAMDHSSAFIAQSALAALAVNADTLVFVVVYSRLAQKNGLIVSLGVAYGVWLAVAALQARVAWTLPLAILVNVVVFIPALAMTANYRAMSSAKATPRLWWDIPLRVAGVVCLVATVVVAGRLAGAVLAGIAAGVPVVLTSLAIILHPRVGGPVAAAVHAHALPGLIGYATAFAVLAITAVPLGSALALCLGLATCVLWNLGLASWRATRA